MIRRSPRSHRQNRDRRARNRWRGPRWHLLLALSLMLVVALSLVVGSTVLGIMHGMQESAAMRRQSAQFHYEKGLKYLQAGQKDLALAEFQEALRLNPGHLEAQRRVIMLLLPTPTPIPTPTPLPLPTVNPEEPLLQVLEAARADLAAKRWQQAYTRLEQLHLLAPDFRPEEVKDLLYQAAYQEGLELLQEDRMEEALRAFDRALRWRPDDKEALLQRDLAAAYILGISYFYADWDSAIAIFEGLYRRAPDYRDVRSRYIDALENGADYHLRKGDPCRAVAYYVRLQTVAPERVPVDLYREAVALCEEQ